MLARSWAEKTRSLDRSFVVGPPVESIRNRFRGNDDHRRRRQRGTRVTATESDRIDHRAAPAGGVGSIASTDRPNPREMSRSLAGRRASGTELGTMLFLLPRGRTAPSSFFPVPRCRVYLYLYLSPSGRPAGGGERKTASSLLRRRNATRHSAAFAVAAIEMPKKKGSRPRFISLVCVWCCARSHHRRSRHPSIERVPIRSDPICVCEIRPIEKG